MVRTPLFSTSRLRYRALADTVDVPPLTVTSTGTGDATAAASPTAGLAGRGMVSRSGTVLHDGPEPVTTSELDALGGTYTLASMAPDVSVITTLADEVARVPMA